MESIYSLIHEPANSTTLAQPSSPARFLILRGPQHVLFAVTLILLIFSGFSLLCKQPKKQIRRAVPPTPESSTYFDDSDATATAEFQKQIQGTWKLLSYQIQAYGPVTLTRYPLGDNALGHITYTPDGFLSVQIMAKDRIMSTATNPHAGSKAENGEAGSHYMAYCGRYSVGFGREKQLLVKHSIQQSLYPNWIASTQIRIAQIDGDELTLRPNVLPTFYGMKTEAVLKWKKLTASA